MQNFLNFLNLIFWFILILALIESYNVLKILLVAELVWVVLYTMCCYTSSISDSSELITFSLMLLGFAGLEYSIGLLITVLYKNNFNTINFEETTNTKT
jgi:NADH:ubiquinone oxidoreductase subunit K